MCKVFVMTNVKNVKVNTKFLSTVRNEVCRHADQDGFGYALLSQKGDIGGERTMRPLNFRPLIDRTSPRIVDKLPITLKADNAFGTIDLSNPKSLIAHGRLSTNTVSLENTHPFTNGEVALIHNGVVQDPTNTLKNLVSTCDSEILLRYFERGGVEEVEKMVSGYYAFAVVDKEGLLHVVRDDRADLFISYNKSVDSFMIATTAEIIRNVAKEMKWKIEHPEEILEKTYTVFDGNEILSHRSISPRSSTYGSNYYGGNYGGSSYRSTNTSSSTSSATTPTAAESKAAGAGTVVDASSKGTSAHAHGEGSWDEYNFNEPDSEPVPKYRELPGKVAGDNSSTTEATTSSENTSQVQSSGVGKVTRIRDADLTQDETVELIVAEMEDWRTRRASSASDV